MNRWRLKLLPGVYAVAKGSCKPPLRELENGVLAIISDGKSYTWIGPQDYLPASSRVQSGFRALEVEGPLDFELTGVIAGISAVLAKARVPIFALSSYDTDYILVPGSKLAAAVAALKTGGYVVKTI